jgi:hypothetical protein
MSWFKVVDKLLIDRGTEEVATCVNSNGVESMYVLCYSSYLDTLMITTAIPM